MFIHLYDVHVSVGKKTVLIAVEDNRSAAIGKAIAKAREYMDQGFPSVNLAVSVRTEQLPTRERKR